LNYIIKKSTNYKSGAFIAAAVISSIFMLSHVGFSQDVKQTEAKMMKQVDENIEKYRKGDIIIQFRSPDGKPLINAKIEIKQKSHDFLFGCIIFDMIRGENTYREELLKERYKKLFNLAVFPFYWPSYEPVQGSTGWENMLKTLMMSMTGV
jgi:hypothetical protein